MTGEKPDPTRADEDRTATPRDARRRPCSHHIRSPEASPRAPRYRNLLARWACRCERWEEAAKLFAEIGDKRDETVFRSKAVYDYWRRKARKNTAAPGNLQVRVGFEI